MAANDNAMTRFLFAILQQKCLKDIDWNKVAHDPILAQEITNGHAARMRYSRFRAAMLGLEPQRRNRNRVTKKKDDASGPGGGSGGGSGGGAGSSNVKKEEEGDAIDKNSDKNSNNNNNSSNNNGSNNDSSNNNGSNNDNTSDRVKTEKDVVVKPDPGTSETGPSFRGSSSALPSPRIKRKRLSSVPPEVLHNTGQLNHHQQYHPYPDALMHSDPLDPPLHQPAMSDYHSHCNAQQSRMHMRLLTPCSDSDLLQAAAPAAPSSPALSQAAYCSSPVPSEMMLHHGGHHNLHHHHHHPHSAAIDASSPFDFGSPVQPPTPLLPYAHSDAVAGAPHSSSMWHHHPHPHHQRQQHLQHHHAAAAAAAASQQSAPATATAFTSYGGTLDYNGLDMSGYSNSFCDHLAAGGAAIGGVMGDHNDSHNSTQIHMMDMSQSSVPGQMMSAATCTATTAEPARLTMPAGVTAAESHQSHVMVKHEQWDSQGFQV